MTKANMVKGLLGFAFGTFTLGFILFMSLESNIVNAQMEILPNIVEARVENFEVEESIIDFDDSIDLFEDDTDNLVKKSDIDDVIIGNMIYRIDKQNHIIVCYCTQSVKALCNTNVFLANAEN